MRTGILVICFFLCLNEALAVNGIESATNEDLSGMAKLGCSGALVNVGRKESERALILTNGHCVRSKLLRPGEVLTRGDFDRGVIGIGGSKGWVRVRPARIVYATMTDLDVALIEIEESYEKLRRLGSKVYKIANEKAARGVQVRIISGYWKEKQECYVEDIITELLEADWTWRKSLALSKSCQVRGGYSGSPVFDLATGKIVAVVNTGNESGERCTLNNPCEVDQWGRRLVFQDRAYAQPVTAFLGCFTSHGQFELTLETCQLPKP
jgi:V8-like Glu-specific endopeptidase